MKKKLLLAILVTLLMFPLSAKAGTGAPAGSVILDIDAPIIGNNISLLENSTGITVTSQSWTNQTDDVVMSETDVFEANKEYYYSVNFTANGNHSYLSDYIPILGHQFFYLLY